MPYNGEMRNIARQLTVILLAASSTLAIGGAPGSAADICGPRSVAVSDASWVEGSPTHPGTLHFIVLTAGCAAGTVQFQATAGTAAPGVDYVAASGQLNWTPGDSTERTISIVVLGDTAIEPDESFTVELVNPAGLTVIDGTGNGTIIDDDPFTISLGLVDQASRPFCLEICVTCRLQVVSSAPTATDVTVHFATYDGTASAGADYTAVKAKVVIPAGASRAEFGIGIIDDTLPEPDEQFRVSIFEPSAGRIGNGTVTVTLVDG